MKWLARAKAILAELVAFPTASSDSNLDCVNYVRSLLAPLGARIAVIPDATGAKASLLATIRPEADGGVVLLSGHLDVVPVVGQVWTRAPFALSQAGGAALWPRRLRYEGLRCLLPRALAGFAGAPLGRPIHIALTHDEEVGCLGAPALIARLTARYAPAASVVGEPTGMGLVTGHKGCHEYTTRFSGGRATPRGRIAA